MWQTKLLDALLVNTGEIEVHLIDECKQFREVHKRAKDLNMANLITFVKHMQRQTE